MQDTSADRPEYEVIIQIDEERKCCSVFLFGITQFSSSVKEVSATAPIVDNFREVGLGPSIANKLVSIHSTAL